jgi:hypothetical protein
MLASLPFNFIGSTHVSTSFASVCAFKFPKFSPQNYFITTDMGYGFSIPLPTMQLNITCFLKLPTTTLLFLHYEARSVLYLFILNLQHANMAGSNFSIHPPYARSLLRATSGIITSSMDHKLYGLRCISGILKNQRDPSMLEDLDWHIDLKILQAIHWLIVTTGRYLEDKIRVFLSLFCILLKPPV